MSARESPRRLHPLAYRRADERPSPFTVRYDDLAWHILQWPADTVDELREVDVAKRESPARSRYGERLRPSAVGAFVQRLWSARAAYAWNPDLVLSSWVQYDTGSENIGTNTRLRWTIRPGDDLFVVWKPGLAAHYYGRTCPPGRSDCHQAAVDTSSIARQFGH